MMTYLQRCFRHNIPEFSPLFVPGRLLWALSWRVLGPEQLQSLHLLPSPRQLDQPNVPLLWFGMQLSLLRIPENNIAIGSIYGSILWGFRLDDWIYWHLIHSTRDYRQLQSYSYFHTLQFTATKALGSSVFTSPILTTDFNTVVIPV
jgi:hypothetical protein